MQRDRESSAIKEGQTSLTGHLRFLGTEQLELKDKANHKNAAYLELLLQNEENRHC